jgi:hypothetical protein
MKNKIFSKIIMAVVVAAATVSVGTANAGADSRQVSVSSSSVAVKVGSVKKVTVKNVGSRKVKISGADKSIAKVTVSGKTIKVKGISAGKTSVKVTVSGLKQRKIGIRVTSKVKTNAENVMKKKVAGLADEYTTLESYPYFQGWPSGTDKYYKEVQNRFWELTPSYLKDNLVYNKIKIVYKKYTNKTCDGKFESGNKIIIYGLDFKNDSGTLIHEIAHAWNLFTNASSSVKNDYQNDPVFYGPYGSTSVGEFYAEKIATESIVNNQILSDESVLEYIINNSKIKITKIESKKIAYVKFSRKNFISSSMMLNNKTYTNGIETNEYQNHLNDLLYDYAVNYLNDSSYTVVVR